MRTVRYSHPDTQLDDALHATLYALLLGVPTHSDDRPSVEALRGPDFSGMPGGWGVP